MFTFKPRLHCRSRWLLVMTAPLLAMTAPLLASDEPSPSTPTPTPPQQSTVAEIDLRPGARQGLLREGSYLLQAQGAMVHDEEVNQWRFTLHRDSQEAPAYVLRVLPNTFLAEAEQVVQASSEHQLIFEVTGEVLVYKGRNYLLLTNPPRVVGHLEPDEPDEPDDADEPSDPAATEPDGQETRRSTRDAESIMRELTRETGPVQRRATNRNVRRDEANDVADDGTLRDGAHVIMRRGRISREAGGAWVFVFDADASGKADPPMTLLPCLLLERLERHYQVSGNAPVLLSGRVFAYEDRNYLMPAAFALPRDRESIMP